MKQKRLSSGSKTYAQPGQPLYRFLSPRGHYFNAAIERLLCKNELYLTSRKVLNDPFDMRPIIKCDWPISAIRRHLDNIAKEPYRSRVFNGSLLQDALALRGIPKEVSAYSNLKKFRNVFTKYTNQLLDEIGVCCFTEELQNPLLWAHYASSYTGVCFKFAAPESILSSFNNCMKVLYTSERPTIFATQFGALATVYTEHDWDYIVQAGICTKSEAWSVEKEWRLWLPHRAGTYLQLPGRAIQAVFLGPLIDADIERTVVGLVRLSSEPIKVFRTQLSEKQYKIEIGQRII